jgi:hypothetical protein
MHFSENFFGKRDNRVRGGNDELLLFRFDPAFSFPFTQCPADREQGRPDVFSQILAAQRDVDANAVVPSGP